MSKLYEYVVNANFIIKAETQSKAALLVSNLLEEAIDEHPFFRISYYDVTHAYEVGEGG